MTIKHNNKNIQMSSNKRPDNKKFWSFSLKDNSKDVGELLIYGDISNYSWYGDEVTPREFNDELKALGDISTLDVRINSNGGDVFAGQAIYSMLKRHKAFVKVFIDGIAASAASLIAMCGDEIIMPSNSMMMLHKPWTCVCGNSDDLTKAADTLLTIEESVIEAYVNKTGLDKDKVKEILSNESYFTAKQCKELNLCDTIEDTEVSMSINDSYLNVNGINIDMSLLGNAKNNKSNTNNNKSNRDTRFKNTNERVKNMNLETLCKQVGLDYKALSEAGLSDSAIKAMILDVQSASGQNKNKDDKQNNVKSSSSDDVKAAKEQERERINTINSLCSEFNVEDSKREELINSNKGVNDVNEVIVNMLKERNKPITQNRSDISVISEERDKVINSATVGIMLRGGMAPKNAQDAQEFRAMSLRDIAIDVLSRAGVSNPHRLSDDELFKMSMTPDSAFTSILDNTVGSVLRETYQEETTTYQHWCGVGSNKDFKATNHFRLSEADELERITQNGEVTFDKAKDEKVTKQVLSYGKAWNFTREAMINDQLDVLIKLPRLYTNSAKRGRNKLVYKLLCSNGLIFDGKALFENTTHKNLATTKGAVSKETLSEGRKKMRLQKDIRGKAVLNITPAWLLCSADMETTAETFLNSVADPSGDNPSVANVFYKKLQLIVDAELDNYDSGKAWYLAANGKLVDTIEVVYLNGRQEPIIESAVGTAATGQLGQSFRIIDDFGVAALDYKGLFRNDGQ